jgi:hypothetical protein
LVAFPPRLQTLSHLKQRVVACNRVIVEPVSLLSRRLPCIPHEMVSLWPLLTHSKGIPCAGFVLLKDLTGVAFSSYDLTARELLS